MAIALAWGGLHESTAWKLLGSSGVDTCKYKNISATARKCIVGTIAPSGCPPYNANYSDSLKLTSSCN